MSILKMIARVAFFAALTLVLLTAGRALRTRIHVALAASAIPRFTLLQVQSSVGTHNPGVDKPMEQRTVSFGASGAVARKVTDLVMGYTRRTLFDPSSGLHQEIWDDSRTYSVARLSPAEVQARLDRRPDPSRDCLAAMDGSPLAVAQPVVLGRSSWLGYAVVQTREDYGSGGALTSWLAPDLACEALSSEFVVPGKGTATVRTTAVMTGPGYEDLFVTGPSYTALGYRDSFLAHVRASGLPENLVMPSMEKSLARQEQFYSTHRP